MTDGDREPGGDRGGEPSTALDGSGSGSVRSTPVQLGVAGLVGFGLIFELMPRVGLVPAAHLPPTSRILATLLDELTTSRLWIAIGDTLATWAIGLSIAVVAGAVVGVVIGSVPALRVATASTIEFLRPIPSVAWIPLAIVLYGSSRTSTLLLVVYAAFWQMLVQVLHGVADVDPVARDTARAYRFGRWARIRFLIWPTALPYAMTGVRLAATVALILTVTGELLIGTPGLGRELALAAAGGAVETMYALVVVCGLVGVAANSAARSAERWALAWHPSVRRERVP